MEAKLDTPQDTRKSEEHLSKDGKWRSFPKVPHLLQYVDNGNYYGRIKIKGKGISESLNTNVRMTAERWRSVVSRAGSDSSFHPLGNTQNMLYD